jgi:site-specific DNA-cytosine methylase
MVPVGSGIRIKIARFRLREGAILQTFPRTYMFVEDGKPVQFTPLARLIVMQCHPRLARLIAKSILQHVNEHYEKKVIHSPSPFR